MQLISFIKHEDIKFEKVIKAASLKVSTTKSVPRLVLNNQGRQGMVEL
jgi:hypothetical protein